MVRQYSTYVAEHLEPTVDNATIVNARRERVREFCHGMLRDPLLGIFASADTRRSKSGVLCAIPLMLAKAAMATRGQNLIDHWHYFQVWFGVPWRIWYWEAADSRWEAVGTSMESRFYSIGFDGDLMSPGRWVPIRAEGASDFGVISDDEALYWIGEIGGPLRHEDYPYGTLVQIPKTFEVVAGSVLILDSEAVFGKLPYTTSLGVPRPTWATLNSAAIGQVFLQPRADTVPGNYDVPVIVTDDNNESDTAIWKVTVTAPVSD